ncbi:MAG: methylenetetrahydrofolate--tRNA-(uracil(54)-C(5))-methyltransferase (FADH(2)-oxidizing) TrmFO [Clostridiales bacterium]|nr:MAG: methylenetetrahydrofolate--tRNA-(uracil(54)-C(5))-methyltransferase (FADH(2)-oxidizing) TrmFO [Clostridiales bacterium]
MKKANVIGAGLAGCEAAYQLAKRGVEVSLYEMKPQKKIPAHTTNDFCELCCSNSFRAEGLKNAIGLLKEELRMLDSLVMRCADQTKVPAGGALAVDRDEFSKAVTKAIRENPNIKIIEKEITSIDFDDNTVIATGPLTSDALSAEIKNLFGVDYLHFFDAAAPIVSADSIDMSKAFLASRYDKGTADYINCPMTKEEYNVFYNALITAEEVKLHGFENSKVFEGCMPVEVMAKRGYETLLFGPLKPVGLSDPRTGVRSEAVVQLRKDNAASSLYNIVGFQTHLTFGEQKRVFSLIPGLENAEFVRYGVMHRNTFINSPSLLTNTYAFKQNPKLFFAGQMTGVEGYIESVSSGFVAGINADPERETPLVFPKETAIGALANYISTASSEHFQPMNINFGLIPPPEYTGKKLKKSDKNELISQRSIELIKRLPL